MKLIKLSTLILFLLTKFSVSADIPMPKTKLESLPDSKYYFANVDSFPEYKFFVKNVNTNKTVKIKETAAFVLKPNMGDENNRLEVWATDKKTNQKTNVFTLSPAIKQKPQEYNTVYIAISFYFDKAGKLNYRQTVLKPDCYGKKQFMPIVSIKTPTNNNNLLLLLSFFSSIVLMFAGVVSNRKLSKSYV